jgi:hypothetical protein
MDDDEFLNSRKVYADEMEALITSGGLQDGKSLAALYLAQPFLQK